MKLNPRERLQNKCRQVCTILQQLFTVCRKTEALFSITLNFNN